MSDDSFSMEYSANAQDFLAETGKVTEALNAVSAAAERVRRAAQGDDLSAVTKHMEVYREIDRIEREIRRGRAMGQAAHPEEARLKALKAALPVLEQAAQAEEDAYAKRSKPAAPAAAKTSEPAAQAEPVAQAVPEGPGGEARRASAAVSAGGKAGMDYRDRPGQIAELQQKLPEMKKAAMAEAEREEKESAARTAAGAKQQADDEKKQNSDAAKQKDEEERKRTEEERKRNALRKQQEKDREREERASLGRLYAVANVLRSIGLYRMAALVTPGRRAPTHVKRGAQAIAGEEGVAEVGGLEQGLTSSGLARFIPGVAAGGGVGVMLPLIGAAAAGAVVTAVLGKMAWGVSKQYAEKAPLTSEFRQRAGEEIPERVLEKTRGVRAAGMANQTLWTTIADVGASAVEGVHGFVKGMAQMAKSAAGSVRKYVTGIKPEDYTDEVRDLAKRSLLGEAGFKALKLGATPGKNLADWISANEDMALQQEQEYRLSYSLDTHKQVRQYRIGVLSRLTGGIMEAGEGGLYGAPDAMAQQGAYVTGGIAAMTRETSAGQEQLIAALKDLTEVVKEGRPVAINWTQILGLGPNWSR